MTELLTLTQNPMLDSQGDAESLVARLERGDTGAVAELYDRHHVAVRAFAKRLVGDVAAAEDLVHDVFVALPKAIRRYRGESSLRTFLIGIAVNHARHHVRSAARRRNAFERLGREPDAPPEDPEHDARRRELARVLTRALDSLSIDQRIAFVLCEVEERTSREAAEIVRVPEATVRTRLFHAKKKLRALLEVEGIR
ncbi:MAG TPA: RNA polymerase sigma factor [Polyangiaceae bacterium]